MQEEDTVTLAEAMMRWERIRHVPVENEAGALVGMLSLPNLLDTLKRGNGQIEQGLKVGEIMERDPVSVTPETPTLEAIALMKDNGLSGLPVVREGKLVGLLTITDFLTVAARLLEG